MSHRNPSDRLELRDGDVSKARDFLDKPYSLLRPFKLRRIAHDLSSLLHHEVDFSEGLEEILPEELTRRADLGERIVEELASRKELSSKA